MRHAVIAAVAALARFNSSRFRRTREARVSAYGRLLSVHLFPQMRNAAKIKTTISPTIDAVKSQSHTTEVFRFIHNQNTLANAGLGR